MSCLASQWAWCGQLSNSNQPGSANLLRLCAVAVCQGTADSFSVPGSLFPTQAVAKLPAGRLNYLKVVRTGSINLESKAATNTRERPLNVSSHIARGRTHTRIMVRQPDMLKACLHALAAA